MINPMNLTGRCFLVTGASSGLGREISIFISKLGGNLVLVGRNVEQLKHTEKFLEGQGHFVEQFDLNEVDAIPKWMKEVVKKTGPLKGLVHSAGVSSTLAINLMNQKRIHQIMDINFNAAVGLTRAFRQKKVAEDNGSIVLISSVAGLKGDSGLSIYGASKGALISLCRSLAVEFAASGVRVNCIAPGHIMTQMGKETARVLGSEQLEILGNKHPLGFGSPDDVAAAVAFLLADTGKWITGTTLVVDGGYTA